MKNRNVLVTSGWLRSSYAVMRSLTAHGVSVYSADVSRIGMCQWSFKNKGHSIYRSHYESEDEFISDLLSIVQKNDIGLIFSSHDETEIIAKYRHFFPEGVCDLIPKYEHCELLNNKKLRYDLAEILEIITPKRLKYNEPNEILKFDNKFGSGSFVVKLLKGNSSKGVFHCEDCNQTFNKVCELTKKYNLSAERMPQIEHSVPGVGWGHSVLYWQGKKIAEFSHKRVLEKIESGGTSTVRRSAKNSSIMLATNKIFDHLEYNGFAMTEFKVFEENNEFWFIEVNPRLWGSLPLAVAAGMDFPYAAYLCAIYGPDKAKEFVSEEHVYDNWYAKWVLGDIFRSISSAFKYGIFQKRVKTKRLNINSYDDLFLDDPFVFFGQMFRYIKNAINTKSTNPEIKGMVK